MVDQALLDIIRNRITIYEVVQPYVRLKKAGNNYSGLCPFHDEKTPSFTVSTQKNFYHCFGCGEHGDIFSFLEKKQNLSFFEAVTILAQKAGVNLPQKNTSPESQSQLKGLFEAHAQAKLWFQKNLLGPYGSEAKRYLHDRGIDDAAIHMFGLGLAPLNAPFKALTDELMRQGFSLEILLTSGLTLKTENGKFMDRFRGRLMFPILSRTQKVIAFGGRILDQSLPKYLNSPETPLFQKNKELYRSPSIDPQKPLFIVEGYLDVITLTQYGFQAVAPLGTAISEHHIEAFWRMNAEPYVCLDGDQAGQKAAWRMIERALPLLKPGHSLFFIHLPENHDPDTYLRTWGAETFQKCLEQATPLFEKILNHEYGLKPLNTPERRADFQERLKSIGQALKDPHLKKFYQDWVREKIQGLFKKTFYKKKEMMPKIPLSVSNLKHKKEQALLALVLKHPILLEENLEEFGQIHLSHPEFKKLQETILNYAFHSTTLDKTSILEHLHKQGFEIDSLLKESVLHLVPFAQSETVNDSVRLGWRELLNRFEKRKTLPTKNNL
jgi:DNA primase